MDANELTGFLKRPKKHSEELPKKEEEADRQSRLMETISDKSES